MIDGASKCVGRFEVGERGDEEFLLGYLESMCMWTVPVEMHNWWMAIQTLSM